MPRTLNKLNKKIMNKYNKRKNY